MKKFNNKILIGAFAGLAVILALTKVFRSPGRETNLDVDAFKIDTTKVAEISLFPQKDSLVEIKLEKKDGAWTATQKNISAAVPANTINNFLTEVMAMAPDRIVTRRKDRWAQYGVTDSLASKVIFKNESGRDVAWLIGKENGGNTYFRMEGDNEVFASHRNIASTFNTTFSNWRDKSFIRITKVNIDRIEFNYPADSAFIIEKINKQWMMGSQKIDSTKLDQYLAKLNFKEHSVFADGVNVERSPDVTVKFSSGNKEEAVIKGWKHSFYQWVLNSSLQPKVNFLDEGGVLARDLFVGKKSFLPVAVKKK
jgi:hypothetical protein